MQIRLINLQDIAITIYDLKLYVVLTLDSPCVAVKRLLSIHTANSKLEIKSIFNTIVMTLVAFLTTPTVAAFAIAIDIDIAVRDCLEQLESMNTYIVAL